MADHTGYRVFCRHGEQSCEPMPRPDKKRADRTAREHAEQHGHMYEVVRVQFTVVETIWPSATAIGAAQ